MKIKERTIGSYEFHVVIIASHIFGSCHNTSTYTYAGTKYPNKRNTTKRGLHWPADTRYPTKIKRKHSCE